MDAIFEDAEASLNAAIDDVNSNHNNTNVDHTVSPNKINIDSQKSSELTRKALELELEKVKSLLAQVAPLVESLTADAHMSINFVGEIANHCETAKTLTAKAVTQTQIAAGHLEDVQHRISRLQSPQKTDQPLSDI